MQRPWGRTQPGIWGVGLGDSEEAPVAGAEQAQGSGGKPVKDCGVASVLGLDVTLSGRACGWVGHDLTV